MELTLEQWVSIGVIVGIIILGVVTLWGSYWVGKLKAVLEEWYPPER